MNWVLKKIKLMTYKRKKLVVIYIFMPISKVKTVLLAIT